MPFTVRQISDSKVRITGPVPRLGGQLVIGLHEATGSEPTVRLPEAFITKDYAYPDGHPVALQDAINVTWTSVSDTPTISVAKTGTTHQDFRITFSESGSSDTGVDVLVMFH